MKSIDENWMIVLIALMCLGSCTTCKISGDIKAVGIHKYHHEINYKCNLNAADSINQPLPEPPKN